MKVYCIRWIKHREKKKSISYHTSREAEGRARASDGAGIVATNCLAGVKLQMPIALRRYPKHYYCKQNLDLCR